MAEMLVHKFFAGFRINNRDGLLLINGTSAPAHLRQGELDGACGIYCIVMGLIACNAVTPGQGREIASARRRLLKTFWSQAAPYFFAGTTGTDLVRLLASTIPMVAVRHFFPKAQSILSRLLKALERQEFVMARLSSWSGDFDHWTVVSGVQGMLAKRQFRTTALLLLDPAFASPKYCLYNGILELSFGKKAHRYFQEGTGHHVYLIEALTLRAKEGT
jgi:hypothetical protein